MAIIKDVSEAIEYIESIWFSLSGLFFSFLAASVFIFVSLKFLFEDTPIKVIKENLWYTQVVVSVVAILFIFILWLFSRRFPKRSNEKIAIVIAVCGDTELSNKIKIEVIEQFRRIIRNTSSANLIEILPLRDFRAKDVTDYDSAFKVSDKTGGQFVIWGKLVNIGDQYEFKLDYLVRHIPLKNKSKIQQGFAEVLVNKRWNFEEKNAMKAIDVTAGNISEICLYITGIAAHQSYDFEVSKKLHTDLLSIFLSDAAKKKVLAQVSSRLPIWLSDSNTALALYAYYNESNIPKAIMLSDEALRYSSNNSVAKLNKALYMFENGDIDESERLIKNLKKENSRHSLSTLDWMYSQAFLLFLRERYDLGLKSYKKVFYASTQQFTLDGVVDFLHRFTIKNPEKIQFYFAHAYVLINKKSNYPDALISLEKFVSQSSGRVEFNKLREIAVSLLLESYQIMQTPYSQQLKF